MIKFFRHIRKSLLMENKTGKYFKYAIGEIILVMIGILLALQVNNWNENRRNNIKEQSLLSAINKEFKANKIQLDNVLYHHDKALESCKNLRAMFPIDIERDNLDSIGKYIFLSTNAWTFNPSQGSINGMINTSSFDIIRNDELRELLVSWQDLTVDYQEDEINGRNVVYNQMDPFFSKYFDFNFNFNDPRNNLEMLESLNFEYLIKLRLVTLKEIYRPGAELENLIKNLDRIIELTTTNDQIL